MLGSRNLQGPLTRGETCGAVCRGDSASNPDTKHCSVSERVAGYHLEDAPWERRAGKAKGVALCNAGRGREDSGRQEGLRLSPLRTAAG